MSVHTQQRQYDDMYTHSREAIRREKLSVTRTTTTTRKKRGWVFLDSEGYRPAVKKDEWIVSSLPRRKRNCVLASLARQYDFASMYEALPPRFQML